MKTKPIIQKFLNSLPKPHFSPAIKLGKSKIAGYGIAAQRNIEEGEILIVERGPIVDQTLIEIIENETGYENNLCVDFGKYLIHAPLHKDFQGGYINHSCNPNVGLLEDGVWCAIKKIKRGSEITCDYGTFEAWPHWEMKCLCKAKNCRKIIRHNDYLLPELQKRMGKWFAPYLRKALSF